MAHSDLGKVAEALIVTAEVMGTELSTRAAEAMARELVAYQPPMILGALRRCQRELRGRLTLADVIARLNDGHLGVEEAWALCPRDEDATVVWTDEISNAFGSARPLLREGDQVGARMAFKESYADQLRQAREAKRAARWWVSQGHSKEDRVAPMLRAVEMGRLPAAWVRREVGYLPGVEDSLRRLEGRAPERMLPENVTKADALVAGFAKKKKLDS